MAFSAGGADHRGWQHANKARCAYFAGIQLDLNPPAYRPIHQEMAVDPLTDLNARHMEPDELVQAELEISAVRRKLHDRLNAFLDEATQREHAQGLAGSV